MWRIHRRGWRRPGGCARRGGRADGGAWCRGNMLGGGCGRDRPRRAGNRRNGNGQRGRRRGACGRDLWRGLDELRPDVAGEDERGQQQIHAEERKRGDGGAVGCGPRAAGLIGVGLGRWARWLAHRDLPRWRGAARGQDEIRGQPSARAGIRRDVSRTHGSWRGGVGMRAASRRENQGCGHSLTTRQSCQAPIAVAGVAMTSYGFLAVNPGAQTILARGPGAASAWRRILAPCDDWAR